MAKIYGLFGSMTGKLADTVMSVRNGEQIARKYQPIVANPNTPAQIEARSKLKLLSQLSAVMALVIAMRKEGNVSSRNLFTKVNYPAVSFTDNTAEVELSAVKLTKSVVSLPSIGRSVSGTSVSLAMATPAVNISRVVYCCFRKAADNTLRFEGSNVVSTPGADNTFATAFDVTAGANYVFYAYGVRDNTDAARVAFGNLQVITAETVAKIITSRRLTESDITLTETQFQSVEVPAQQN